MCQIHLTRVAKNYIIKSREIKKIFRKKNRQESDKRYNAITGDIWRNSLGIGDGRMRYI